MCHRSVRCLLQFARFADARDHFYFRVSVVSVPRFGVPHPPSFGEFMWEAPQTAAIALFLFESGLKMDFRPFLPLDISVRHRIANLVAVDDDIRVFGGRERANDFSFCFHEKRGLPSRYGQCRFASCPTGLLALECFTDYKQDEDGCECYGNHHAAYVISVGLFDPPSD